MFLSPASLVTRRYCQNHAVILRFLNRLTDAQLHWQLDGGNNPIAWHAWHLARWADYTQAALPGMRPELARLGSAVQVWHSEGLAARWGFAPDQLGFAETGMDMPDSVALTLPFPPKNQLLGYLTRAFSLADHRVASLTDAEIQSAEQPQPLTEGIFGGGTIGSALLEHVIHDYRHLGMMEALLGMQGQPGTATR
jgi:hypothetical protein